MNFTRTEIFDRRPIYSRGFMFLLGSVGHVARAKQRCWWHQKARFGWIAFILEQTCSRQVTGPGFKLCSWSRTCWLWSGGTSIHSVLHRLNHPECIYSNLDWDSTNLFLLFLSRIIWYSLEVLCPFRFSCSVNVLWTTPDSRILFVFVFSLLFICFWVPCFQATWWANFVYFYEF